MKKKENKLPQILTAILAILMILTGTAFIASSKKTEENKETTEETPSYANKLEEEMSKFKEAQEAINNVIYLEIEKDKDIADANTVSFYQMYGIIQNVVEKDDKVTYVFMNQDNLNYFLSAVQGDLTNAIQEEYSVTINTSDFQTFDVVDAKEEDKKNIEKDLREVVNKYQVYHKDTKFLEVIFS